MNVKLELTYTLLAIYTLYYALHLFASRRYDYCMFAGYVFIQSTARCARNSIGPLAKQILAGEFLENAIESLVIRFLKPAKPKGIRPRGSCGYVRIISEMGYLPKYPQ